MNRSRLDALIMAQEGLSALTRRDIERIQLEGLNRLLRREGERQGFYRHLPDHLDHLSQLSSLPFTTDEDLAHHAGSLLLTSQSQIQRVLSDATSGTTGAAKRVFYTEGDCGRTIALYMAGLGELVYPGSVTMICFPFSGPFGLGDLIAEAITRLGARPLKLGPSLTYGEYARVLEEERPDTFVGMPVQLLSLLRCGGRGSLRRALISGDACPGSVTAACEGLLGSRLFPHYGSREMGMAGAITCPAHEGMHLRENHIIAEIIGPEGDVLPRGRWGELVITTIGMEALPLIRYRTGDYTRILPGPCPCGSETLRLDTLRRKAESPDLVALDNALFSHPGVIDGRWTLSGRQLHLHVRLLPGAEAAPLEPLLRPLCPGLGLEITAETVSPSHTALYPGKRHLLRQG